jgi:hypothetical protein
MTIDNFDLDNSNAPTATVFKVSDGQTYGIEFNAETVKEFEIKKIALSSIPKHSYIKEIQVKDIKNNWLNNNSLINKFGNGIVLDLTQVDFDFYYEKLVTKAKASWALSHVSLTLKTKPELKLT